MLSSFASGASFAANPAGQEDFGGKVDGRFSDLLSPSEACDMPYKSVRMDIATPQKQLKKTELAHDVSPPKGQLAEMRSFAKDSLGTVPYDSEVAVVRQEKCVGLPAHRRSARRRQLYQGFVHAQAKHAKREASSNDEPIVTSKAALEFHTDPLEMQVSGSEETRPPKRRLASMRISREAAEEAMRLSGMPADHCRYCRWLHKAAEFGSEEASSSCEPGQQRMSISQEAAQEAIRLSGMPAEHCRYCQWLHRAAAGDAEGSSSCQRGNKRGWLSFTPRLEWTWSKRRRLSGALAA
eukprot:TRINITY_DN1306_c0_g1_i2.p1 TRINITY_DN1306_c0_g1~~TRINITY_DN1306_c0_g1_i2.p1  ORF type:complete len:319 (-),score=47.63 TRINITY_DN1306_c0_g1_i2:378-1262(-)